MEYNEIVGLMQEMTKTGLTKIKIEKEEFKLVLEKNNISNDSPIIQTFGKEQNTPVNMMSVQTSVTEQGIEDRVTNEVVTDSAKEKKELPGTKKILSPMVGTFYSSPAPDKPSYVNVGDVVKKGQTVCIIEAMKLMNEIESEVEGEILECLVGNEEMVEYGQPLFLVK